METFNATKYIKFFLLRDEVKDYITANFGGRCDPPMTDPKTPCPCCEAWKAYDTIFEWEDEDNLNDHIS